MGLIFVKLPESTLLMFSLSLGQNHGQKPYSSPTTNRPDHSGLKPGLSCPPLQTFTRLFHHHANSIMNQMEIPISPPTKHTEEIDLLPSPGFEPGRAGPPLPRKAQRYNRSSIKELPPWTSAKWSFYPSCGITTGDTKHRLGP